VTTAGGEKKNVYKIFSDVEMDEKTLNSLFSTRLKTHKHLWEAYPVLSPITNDHLEDCALPFQLHDQLYYVNGVESIFSVIEISSLGGQNIAQMLYNSWRLNK
jgi:prenylcysteine oxidase/farnesylcysteine lyase